MRKENKEAVSSQWLSNRVDILPQAQNGNIIDFMTGDPQKHAFDRKSRSRSKTRGHSPFSQVEIVKNPLDHLAVGSPIIGHNDHIKYM